VLDPFSDSIAGKRNGARFAKRIAHEFVHDTLASLRRDSPLVFSSMTSFTHCSGTSFTLPRERSERGGAMSDDLEKRGRSGTTGAIRSGGESAGEDVSGLVPGL
jgi:hypothetical protein